MAVFRLILILFTVSFMGSLEARSPSRTHQLRDSLMQAEPGDFLVTIQGKMYTLMHIYDKKDGRLIIEEITLPKGRVPNGGHSWRDWVAEGAPGHTAWVMYEIDIYHASILEFYSFSQRAWGDVSQGDNFLCTLLRLQLGLLDKYDRKKIGPRPLPGEMDRRRLWNPRLVVDGEVARGVEFDAWRTYWPRDGSDLSGKKIDLYLPREGQGHLSYFPAWLEVSGTIGRAQLRIVDSGRHLKSPQPSLPRRPPEFVDQGQLNAEGLSFRVSAPQYYEKFTLFASGMQDGIRQLIEIPHQASRGVKDGELIVKVAKDELNQRLKKGYRYSFVLQPVDYPQVGAETYDSWLWK